MTAQENKVIKVIEKKMEMYHNMAKVWQTSTSNDAKENYEWCIEQWGTLSVLMGDIKREVGEE